MMRLRPWRCILVLAIPQIPRCLLDAFGLHNGHSLLAAFAERSADDLEHPGVSIHVHSNDQSNPVVLDAAHVNQLVTDAARKAVEESQRSTNGGSELGSAYSKGPPRSKSVGSGITITTGGNPMMPPYMAPPLGYPMMYPPYGMPGGSGVSINIQKDESASEIVKKALGEEWAKGRSSSVASRDQSSERGNLSNSDEFESNRRSNVVNSGLINSHSLPEGRPPSMHDSLQSDVHLNSSREEELDPYEHNHSSNNKYGGGNYGLSMGSNAPDMSEFDEHQRSETDEFGMTGRESFEDQDIGGNSFNQNRSIPPLPDVRGSGKNWDKLPAVNPRGPRGGMPREGETAHFQKTAGEAADGLLNTANVVREEATKATDHLLNLHGKIQDWHSSVRQQTQELNVLQENIQKLWSAAMDTLHEHDQKRMERFNSLVKNDYGGTDCVGPYCDPNTFSEYDE